MPSLPAPHGDKLRALAQNRKLPPEDRPRVERAIERYQEPIAAETLARFLGHIQKLIGSDTEDDVLARGYFEKPASLAKASRPRQARNSQFATCNLHHVERS